jgi:hypothetical protein
MAHSYHDGGGQLQFILSDDQDSGYGVLMSKTYMAALVCYSKDMENGLNA